MLILRLEDGLYKENIMAWKGEENIGRYFGLRGLKCLCLMLMDEVNELRQKANLPKRTWQQVLAKMDGLMEEHKTDDEGPEPV